MVDRGRCYLRMRVCTGPSVSSYLVPVVTKQAHLELPLWSSGKDSVLPAQREWV